MRIQVILIGSVVPNVSKDHGAFTVRVKQSFFVDCLILRGKGTKIVWDAGNLSPNDSFTYQTPWILRGTTVKTLDFKMLQL